MSEIERSLARSRQAQGLPGWVVVHFLLGYQAYGPGDARESIQNASLHTVPSLFTTFAVA